MFVENKATRERSHAYLCEVNLMNPVNPVKVYIMGQETAQGYVYNEQVVSKQQFESLYTVLNQEEGKTPGWMSRELDHLKKFNHFFIKLIGLYHLNHEAYFREIGTGCYDFVNATEYATKFDNLDDCINILQWKAQYLAQYNAKDLVVIGVD